LIECEADARHPVPVTGGARRFCQQIEAGKSNAMREVPIKIGFFSGRATIFF
jgi:hypothetical protein